MDKISTDLETACVVLELHYRGLLPRSRAAKRLLAWAVVEFFFGHD